MQWFKKQAKTLIGIDIDARAIKLIALSKTALNTFEIRHVAIKELPMMVLAENQDIKDHATISATLIQLKNSLGIESSQVAIALPGSSVVTKQIFIDASLTGLLLEDQVWLEAGRHFPDLIEDLSLDFFVNGLADVDNTKSDILLVACRKTSIQKRLEILQECHFQAQIVDVDYYALERSLRYLISYQTDYQANSLYALINFNSRSSTLIVIQGTRLLYAYDQSFDGIGFHQLLQHQLQWPNYLMQPELLPTALNDDAIALLDSHLIGHLRHSLQLFNLSTQGPAIDLLFLAGDMAVIPGLDTFVTDKLQIPVKIANPIRQMQIADTIDQARLSAMAPLLTLCCGLALQVGL